MALSKLVFFNAPTSRYLGKTTRPYQSRDSLGYRPGGKASEKRKKVELSE